MFPEYGITGFLLTHNISVFLEYVPNPYNKNLNPCDQSEFNDRPILQRLSCLAKKYHIFVVANLASKLPCEFDPSGQPCPPRGYFQYNTDVAMSAEGQLVAKYNKINLYTEEQQIFDFPISDDPTNYGVFDTSFGTFGMFTCFDMLFGNPAEQLVRGMGVTDMVFPTAWMNELPLLSAIEIQEAWSMQFNVPLLAANIHLPIEQMTGSGIYNARQGHVVYHYDMVTNHGKLLIGNIKRPATQERISLRPDVVKKLVTKLKQSSSTELHNIAPQVLAVLKFDTRLMPKFQPASKHVSPNPANFPPVANDNVERGPWKTFQALLNDDLYTFVSLPYDTVTVWVSDNNISCWLNYSRKEGGKDHYALGAFDGWHTMNGRYRVQACALVRCPYGDWSKCGQETTYSGTIFNWFSLQISGMDHNAVFFPEIVTSGVHLAKIGTEWKNDCPACSWVYSDINKGIKEPLLAANLFARVWDHVV